MPWKVSSVMDERLCFIARLLEGGAMTDLCVSCGISRKTGYKIYDRYKQSGAEALSDRSRRLWRHANQLPPQLEAQIVGLKRSKPHWGARKIRELLVRRLASGALADQAEVLLSRQGDYTSTAGLEFADTSTIEPRK